MSEQIAQVERQTASARIAEAGDPFEPIVVNRPAERLNSPFKVVAFNAWGCGKPDVVANLLCRPPLAGAAIILLSEADWGLRRSSGCKSAAEIAQRLGMSFAYSPEFAFRREEGEFTSFFGNAILAAAPLENVRFVPLQMVYDWTKRRKWKLAQGSVRLGQRGGVAAEINLNGRPLAVALAHLENRAAPEQRGQQMAQFLGALESGAPAIIGGDLNTTTVDLRDWRNCAAALACMLIQPRRLRAPESYEPLFEVMAAEGFEYGQANARLKPTYALSGLLPRVLRAKLDWIALRGVRAVPGSAEVVPARRALRRISDHDFIVCEFEV
jgi:endonuclease/exonuclease/phosphatase family metal-dependent hydrolase